MFTADHLTRFAKACGAKPNADVIQGIVENQEWLALGGIDRPARVVEFLTQACLETDYFKTLTEYASGRAYEGRKDLGNVVAGDGVRFKGRGIFQCTGRANYQQYGKRLGLDLLKEPALAARPDVSMRIAVMYWNDRDLSIYADVGDTKAISRAINRGSARATKPANHEADRIKIAKLARGIIKAAPEAAQADPAPPSPEPGPTREAPPAATPATAFRNAGASTTPASEKWWHQIVNKLLGKEP